MMGLYLLGILLAILAAVILKSTVFRGQPVPFVMELPNYRLPSAKSVALLLWEKAKDFLSRAFTVILLATVAIWFLQSFDYRLNFVENGADSMLAYIGRGISVIFRPLGFEDWRITTALVSGFTAKEAVVSSLAVLTETSTSALGTVLPSLFASPLAAVSFLVFTLLYTPCVAAVTAIRKEFGSFWATLGIVVMQCVVAYAVSLVIYSVGSLFI